MSLNAILPSPEQHRPGDYGELYQIWRKDRRAKFEQWRPTNVRFTHDPLWRERFMSITAARERRNIVWKMIAILFYASMLMGPGFGLAMIFWNRPFVADAAISVLLFCYFIARIENLKDRWIAWWFRCYMQSRA
jgi:hypothetical protein